MSMLDTILGQVSRDVDIVNLSTKLRIAKVTADKADAAAEPSDSGVLI